MKVKLDIIGKKFGRLTVLKFYEIKNGRSLFWCRCDCREMRLVSRSNLVNGTSKSCGCYNKEVTSKRFTKHGLTNERPYEIWCGIKKRCDNPNAEHYNRYGGRGITICDEWRNNAEEFIKWSLKNGYKKNLSIDRIDNNGNYEPNNCRWITQKEQTRNTNSNIVTEYKGIKKTLSEIAEITGIRYGTLQARYRAGDREERLIRPVRKLHNKAKDRRNLNEKHTPNPHG